ncbi:hypothetical protein [Phenylobacterium sp. SCN 70-31]|uniref:hypothetical protein n=1 Tax=Phenylobacterium sp. SCN 70-31 TaxID=1660129 RepID=UPI000868E8CE|nr:hypothetical protein [Phenylobacterium sp. SCN 70-31]ODT89733.1 MAG: hypothetical protein ABS78_01305 [Phenylobacterium sp. SCN 70-31]
MTLFRSAWARFAVGMAAGLFLAGAITGLRGAGYHLEPAGLLALFLLWAVGAAWLVGGYWRSLDEAAREAQKWAWYWGGSIGMGVGAFALVFEPLGVAAMLPADASRPDLLAYGAGVVVAAQMLGFLVAWAWWWGSRR